MQEQSIRMEGLVASGLALLAEGLAPFVDKVMSRKDGTEKWFDAFCQDGRALTKFGHNGRAPKKSDLAFQLKLLLDDRFGNVHRELGYRGKTLCIQLRNDRNSWCHNKVSAPQDALVTLDRIEQLLLLIGADTQARQVAALLDQVRRRGLTHQLNNGVNHSTDATPQNKPHAPEVEDDDYSPDECLMLALESLGVELDLEDIRLLGLDEEQNDRICHELDDMLVRYLDDQEEFITHSRPMDRYKASLRKKVGRLLLTELPARRSLACALASERLAVALGIDGGFQG